MLFVKVRAALMHSCSYRTSVNVLYRIRLGPLCRRCHQLPPSQKKTRTIIFALRGTLVSVLTNIARCALPSDRHNAVLFEQHSAQGVPHRKAGA